MHMAVFIACDRYTQHTFHTAQEIDAIAKGRQTGRDDQEQPTSETDPSVSASS